MMFPFYIRMTILLCVGGFAPILIHHLIMELWDVSVLRAAEYTFIVCIPIAVWMAEKINERWNDEDQ